MLAGQLALMIADRFTGTAVSRPGIERLSGETALVTGSTDAVGRLVALEAQLGWFRSNSALSSPNHRLTKAE